MADRAGKAYSSRMGVEAGQGEPQSGRASSQANFAREAQTSTATEQHTLVSAREQAL